MAYTNFYIQAGASDLNAGSTTDSAAAFTYAGGTFVRATGVFTVASGDPLADGVAVNDWVSIYTTSGAVAATFVGKCTARDATTITVSTTVILGLATAVSEGAGLTTAKVGGAWASEIVLAATGLGTFTTSFPLKINIKQATYTVAASRTISMAGTTTLPVWFSGYNTTPGDIDADTTNALAKPVFALNATFQFTASGGHQTWSGLSITGNRSGTLWSCTASGQRYVRCRYDNVSSNVAAIAFTVSAFVTAKYCWFKTPATATTSGTVLQTTGTSILIGCTSEGSGIATYNQATGIMLCLDCISLNATGHGWLCVPTSASYLQQCTVYNATGDGVRFTGTLAAFSMVVGCLFETCGGIGINNSSGTNTNFLIRACNDFHACTGGNEVGLGDSPAFFGQTDASTVVTSSTDMTPVVGSNARNNGFPGKFENQSFTSYLDIGAVEHVDPSGGSGGGPIIGGSIVRAA